MLSQRVPPRGTRLEPAAVEAGTGPSSGLAPSLQLLIRFPVRFPGPHLPLLSPISRGRGGGLSTEAKTASREPRIPWTSSGKKDKNPKHTFPNPAGKHGVLHSSHLLFNSLWGAIWVHWITQVSSP